MVVLSAGSRQQAATCGPQGPILSRFLPLAELLTERAVAMTRDLDPIPFLGYLLVAKLQKVTWVSKGYLPGLGYIEHYWLGL